MLPFIAVPLLHSSGAWIGATSAGYVGGTLSGTWIGAFIAGNAGILSGLGITSAAGVFAAMAGGLSSAGAALGSGLSAVGLAGVAQSLGLAPATFLGLTVASWAMAGTGVVAAGIGYFYARRKLGEINYQRAKGGLAATTWTKIIAEARDYEKQALMNILERLETEFQEEIILDRSSQTTVINGENYKIRDLIYVIEKSGTEYIAKRSIIPFIHTEIFFVRGKGIS